MEQIIYEEFVNNIYERANFNLSEEKTRMIEEFMRQIFNEAEATAKKDSNLPQEPESDAKSQRQINLEPQPRPQDPKDKPVADKAKGNDGPATAGAEKEPEAAKAAEKEPEAAADVAKDPEDKKNAQQVTQQVVYVIQQAEPQNFRQFMKKHGLIGGILKKTFELAFGTDVWRDPADARYFLSGVYQNPYNAPMLAVQFLQQNREQILAAAGNDPNITQVANQIANAGKKAAAKTETDPEKEKLDATEDERTDVDDALSGAGEEKPEETPGEETEEPGEEKPEEGKAQVPKDDVDWGGVEGNKQRTSNWESKNLVDEPPGDKRVMLAQQTLLPDLIFNTLANVKKGTGAREKQKQNLSEYIDDGASVNNPDRINWDNKNDLMRSLGIEGDLAKALNNAKHNSIKRDGLFSSVFELMFDKPEALRDIYLNTSPEVFARAMVPLLDTTVNKFIKVLGSQHGSIFSQFLEKEKSANSGDQAPPSDSSSPETSTDARRRKRDRPQARRIRGTNEGQGMKAYMENKNSEKLTSPKVGHGILAWALEKVSARMKGKKERAARHAKDMAINKEDLTPENITKAVTEWHANKGIILQEGKAKKIAESILKVIK